jgi:hypothetical protein
VLTRFRWLLSRKVSIAAMIEAAMWIAIPYLVIGIVFTFLHADDVARIETEMQTRIPAGAELVGFGATAAAWPFLLFGHEICAP